MHEFAVLVRDIQVCSSFDADGNGTLDSSELGVALKQLGMTSSHAQTEMILSAWD